MKRWIKMGGGAVASVVCAAGLWAAWPGTIGNYLVMAALGQGELLWGRVPVAQLADDERFTAPQRENLARIAPIKEFGKSIGLSSTDNYESISPDWDHTIWNVSACHATAFEPATWWFPVVGRMPYLGYFDRSPAQVQANRLREAGLDVHVRTAGAYSTLGWFRDPVLPGMLDWSEERLANTVLHELAHPTLWIPGSVQFNESFANFVGNVATERYLAHTYGPESEPVLELRHATEDRQRYQAALVQVYADLDAIYTDDALDEADKRAGKARVLASIPVRVAALGLHRAPGYIHHVQTTEWNNARLLQFRTYNRSHEWFAALLAANDNDLSSFIQDLERVTTGAEDPYQALAQAVGADPEAQAAER